METTNNSIIGDTILASKWFNPDYLFSIGSGYVRRFFNYLGTVDSNLVAIYNGALFIFALFFLTIIFYTAVRMFEIRAKERKHLRHEIAEFAHHQAERARKKQEGEGSKNERWVKTLSYLFSQHASDWKLAIIEADSMLEALMAQLGFKGETLGDKLKSATQENFHGLSFAWEAHTVRNKIAHEGGSFDLSQREAKRVIALYEQIFREFGYI